MPVFKYMQMIFPDNKGYTTRHKLTMYKNKNLYFRLFLVLLILVPMMNIHADGSRNWANPGSTPTPARRAFLRSSTSATANWPFPNLGTHYVYAKAGERITVASSLQATGTSGNNNKRIRLYAPDGTQITLDFTNGGNIENRSQEIAGPHLFGSTSGGYNPVYYLVPPGGDGIYRVEFLSTSNSNVSGSINVTVNNFGQSPNSNTVTIAAWDVSVINTSNTGFIDGRVYTNMLNLSVGTGNATTTGFYGLVYVRTKDGYTYRVNNNGNNGMYFTFFVNNNGFVDAGTQEPIYKSLDFSTSAQLSGRVHNPNLADAGTHSTHKLFYTLPADDLPLEADITETTDGINWNVSGKKTWLNTEPQTPIISNVVLKGADGTENQFSQKGGWIEFNANLEGNYRIEIRSSSNAFPPRAITGHAYPIPAINRVYWDGKDGEGGDLPAGDVPLSVEVRLQGAEVHFPFFDMEYNFRGTIIELLEHENLAAQNVRSDVVYWNDNDITNSNPSNPKNNSHLPPTYSAGLSSNVNGHVWGNNFGNEVSIDTWTFITGPKQSENSGGILKKADLKVTEVSTDKSFVAIGEEITYTVKVKNGETGDGGSDVVGAPFSFMLPDGFSGSLGSATFNGNSCGTQSVPLSYNAATRTYTSSLDLPNGCEVVYTFMATVTSSATPGDKNAEAAILRPYDVTDPNATNRSNPENPLADPDDPNPDVDEVYVPPFDANYECNNRFASVTEPCNNIGSVVVNVSANSTVAVDDFVETEQNTSVSGNVLTNDYDPEDHMQTVSNTGTYTTNEGGSITISANGNYSYTPPNNYSGLDEFEYTVCDNGSPQACDNAIILIGVGICTEGVDGEYFSWSQTGSSGTVTQTMTQPATNYGFVFDIYELDNSFNMEINGTKIAVSELEFQSSGTPGINVQFADGDEYETNTENIWAMIGDAENPLIRVIISPTGSITLWGSKVSYGPLFPLVLTANTLGQNSFNNVPWNSEGTNTIIVTQNVVGATLMNGYGYGQNIIPCVNYWMGGTAGQENEWNVPANWTDNKVPAMGQDVKFATVDNYGTAANADLYLDDMDQNSSGGRIIGNLVNNSDKNLVITTGNQLTINGRVEGKAEQSDGTFGTGTIVVKSTNITTNENEPTGTLIINPNENPTGVQAIVEFYNKAYDCEDCGFYTRSWQYFGIPVEESGTTVAPLPFTSAEEVNEWSEPTNGNKWIDPATPLTAFTGYEITRNETVAPDYTNAVHQFEGTLNIGNATVTLTRTDNVNYQGVNLVGNSFTAAIPIKAGAMTFPAGVEETVYLFNTGTRDQWRKLNGSVINQEGYRSGQYLAVPVNLGGQNEFPDRIPSMHAFMVLVESGSGGNLGIDYSQLLKNTTVNRGNGEQITTRSVGSESAVAVESTIPSLVFDMIGEQSADRVWIFAKDETSYGFDNGWDGRKMSESGIVQLYVADDAGEERFQVAAVPGLDNLQLGFEADADGTYTIEFALSDHWTTEEIYMHDLATGTKERVMNGGSYTFEAKKGDSGSRFRLSSSGDGIPGDDESAKITVNATGDGKIVISNNGSRDCTAFVSDTGGKHLQQLEVRAGEEQVMENITRGIYIVRLQNAVVNDVRRVVVE